MDSTPREGVNGTHAEFARSACLVGVTLAAVVGAIAIGASRYFLGAIGAAVALLVCLRRPVIAIQLALVVCASFQILAELPVLPVGPLSVYTPDAALALLVLVVLARARRGSGPPAQAARALMWALLPLGFMLVLGSLNSLVQGASWQTVGVALRTFAWYAAAPLIVLLLVDRRVTTRVLWTTQATTEIMTL